MLLSFRESPAVRDPAFLISGKREELLGIGTLAMLAGAHAEEIGAHAPPHRSAVFLAHASPPSHTATDSELIVSGLVRSTRNRRLRGVRGLNPRLSRRDPFGTISTDFF